jgi:hypothetical protein
VDTGVAKPPSKYTAAWSTLDNNTGATNAVGETSSGTYRILAPAGLPSASGSFIVADVRAESEHPSWSKPVRATFNRTASGWKLVGLDRIAESSVAAAK